MKAPTSATTKNAAALVCRSVFEPCAHAVGTSEYATTRCRSADIGPSAKANVSQRSRVPNSVLFSLMHAPSQQARRPIEDGADRQPRHPDETSLEAVFIDVDVAYCFLTVAREHQNRLYFRFGEIRDEMNGVQPE